MIITTLEKKLMRTKTRYHIEKLPYTMSQSTPSPTRPCMPRSHCLRSNNHNLPPAHQVPHLFLIQMPLPIPLNALLCSAPLNASPLPAPSPADGTSPSPSVPHHSCRHS